jgi:hypothetical protein
MAAGLKLSVIIPVGPGDDSWGGLLRDLAALAAAAEIILVATPGQSPAGFAPQSYGLRVPARWLESPAGRARQQNAGAAAARGDALWFLHADSRLPARTVAAALGHAGREGLAFFRLEYLGDGPRAARLNAFGAMLRSRWLGLPFGDQGFLLSRQDFERLGRFKEAVGAGEDHALVWQARAQGVPLVALPEPVRTSARRYREQGWLGTTLRHARLTVSQAARFRALARRERAAT